MRHNRSLLLVLAACALTGCAEKIDTPAEFLELAYRHERSSQFPEAVAAYRQSLKLNEQQPTAWYDLGVAYAAMDQFPDAIVAYTRAIELDRGMARAFNNRAAAYARLKQFDKAISDCDQAVALAPDDFLAWRNRGLARHDNGELDSAISDYDESIRINGRVAETYHARGNVHLEKKDWDRALQDFDQAIHLDSSISAVWLSRAITLARLGRGPEAEASKAKAGELGSATENVVIADLLPQTSSSIISPELKEQAIQFAKKELDQSEPATVESKAPWTFVRQHNSTEHRYIVRVLADGGENSSVQFTSDEIAQFEASSVATSLMIVRPIAGSTSKVDGAASFEVVKTIDNWTPDRSKMSPVLWSWTLDEEGEKASPVAAAVP
jgi:tetratricopeptide (TPR) repeat protein